MDRQHLIALLEQDELGQVVEIFRKISPSLNKSLQGQIILTVSQYNGYLKDKHGGGVSQGHLGITLNKLRASMNYHIGQLPESVFPIAGFAPNPGKPSPVGNTPREDPGADPIPSLLPAEPAGRSLWLGAAALLAVVGIFAAMVLLQGKMGNAEPLGEILFIVLLGILAGVAYFQLMPPSEADADGKWLGMNLKLRGPIVAGVLVAVGSFVFLQARGGSGPFDFTVRLQAQDLPDYPPLKGGKLKVWIVNRYEKPELNSDLLAEVKGVPASEKGKRVDVLLEGATYWKLAVDSVTLSEASQTLRVVPDGSLDTLSGKVTDADGNAPLPGATVEVEGGLSSVSDAAGRFVISIPAGKQKEVLLISATKTGYEKVEERHNPASGEKVFSLRQSRKVMTNKNGKKK